MTFFGLKILKHKRSCFKEATVFLDFVILKECDGAEVICFENVP